jgi:hypothetical protein
MRRLLLLPCLLTALLATGCGDSSRIKAKGRITKDGQPFTIADGEGGLRLFLVPMNETEGQGHDSYFAEYHAGDGTFEVLGKDGKGVPPGKYRVHLEHMKDKNDLFGGRLMGAKSPLTCEVAQGKELEVNLDNAHLDQPPPDKAAGSKPKGNRRR